MIVDELKIMRDSAMAVQDFWKIADPDRSARYDKRVAILNTLIKLFEGDSAEADELDRLAYMYEGGSANEYAKEAAACKSGALALRALPQVMAEVERLRAELAEADRVRKEYIALKRGRIAVENLIRQQVQIPPEFAQVLNDNFWDLA